MSEKEFSDQFDILYNNISSNAAPNIDLFEKSVYLTKAQLEIVKEYNDVANKYQKGFDGSEKRRIDLKELIVDYKTSIFSVNNNKLTSRLNSKFFNIPSDIFLIKHESAKYMKTPCTIEIKVVPITLDEFNTKINNPFKKPDNTVAWRVDFNSISNNKVEILSSENLSEYHVRYLKYPEPIILTDLNTNPQFTGMNLSIEGVTTSQTCKLNQEIHSEILDRSVELALRDYRENTLSNKIQTNIRNN